MRTWAVNDVVRIADSGEVGRVKGWNLTDKNSRIVVHVGPGQFDTLSVDVRNLELVHRAVKDSSIGRSWAVVLAAAGSAVTALFTGWSLQDHGFGPITSTLLAWCVFTTLTSGANSVIYQVKRTRI